jgi:tol-pal system protein YbgF
MLNKAFCAAALAAALCFSSPARAADKAHQQLMAEIRMLQEQQQQLQQLIGGLTDALKTVTAKLDDQANVSRKAFADQKLLIDNVADGVRVLREKADDTNVRLSTVSQELEAVRQAIASMPAPSAAAPAPTVNPAAPGDPAPAGSVPPASAAAGPGFVSPQKMFDNAYSDYMAGQYELAIVGFNTYISSFPKSDKADDAQLNIGNSLYGAGKFRDAIDAYQKVVADYPNGDSVPVAYYKMGLTYEQLRQFDLARRAFEMVQQKYPSVPEAFLAKQGLERIKGR